MNMKCEEQVKELSNVLLELNKIDEIFDNLVNQQSNVDMKISDVLHFVEDEEVSVSGAHGIYKELKKLRKERREIKQLIEIHKVYTNNINKLIHKNNREFLIAELNKVYKGLQTDYKPRIYTKNELLTIAKKKIKEENN